jgi:hypothetical protein
MFFLFRFSREQRDKDKTTEISPKGFAANFFVIWLLGAIVLLAQQSAALVSSTAEVSSQPAEANAVATHSATSLSVGTLGNSELSKDHQKYAQLQSGETL